MNKQTKKDPIINQLKKTIRKLELDLIASKEAEKSLEQRIQIDGYISTNKQQTMFAQLRAVEARLHLAYTIMDLQKKKEFTNEKNLMYAEEYLNLIKSKVLV